nr:hypothetical protein L203_03584 [Cryptococcus depauperatus CBS 7841]
MAVDLDAAVTQRIKRLAIQRPLEDKIRLLRQDVLSLLDRIFQCHELRHTCTMPSEVEFAVASLGESLAAVRTTIGELQDEARDVSGEKAVEIAEGVEQLVAELQKAEEKQRDLKHQLKRDGWLVDAAEQAEGLMEPLQKSLGDCREYLARLSRAIGPIPEKSAFEEQLSLEGLERLSRNHDALVRTYVSSTTRILRRLDKNIVDHKITNGSALRRQVSFNEISQRWMTLQAYLQDLDLRLQMAIEQVSSSVRSSLSSSDIEILADYPSLSQANCYAAKHRSSFANGPRSSISSYASSSSIPSIVQPPRRPSSIQPSQSRRASVVSSASIATTHASLEKPRWNSSPRVVDTETPTFKRTGSNMSRSPRAASPTPSNTSATSFRQSRLPIYSPQSVPKSPQSEVALEGRNRHIPHFSLSRTSTPGKGQSHLERARLGLKTPEPVKSRQTGIFSALQPRTVAPSISRTCSSTSVATSKTVPTPRSSLTRYPPPSSFNSPTPKPPPSRSGRPSSRLSAASFSSFDHSVLHPFQPSPYDELDKAVAKIIQEEGFQDHSTARVDQPLRRGQRLGPGQEWKGEYIFGAGQRPVSVKRIELNPRKGEIEKRVRVMVKAGGRWLELKELLRDRKDLIEVMSP